LLVSYNYLKNRGPRILI